ncbi:MAG TPA: prepilin-type N-terminal cleavage/methylation domain-containing protein [Candidatus Acidoferrales bacterium]|nr:prepilin-type N-terminal cleavage/methylation domain-containing protein [Candidatus Acidoferrales bacterium]
MRRPTENIDKGFSLIELLIVVSIILIIAAIAIPNLIRARIAANQSSAVASLRTLDSAATTYRNTYQDGYPGSLAVLAPAGVQSCDSSGMIDEVLATGKKSGYQFAWLGGVDPVSTIPNGCSAAGYLDMFSVTATPFGYPTGTIYYCVDATGVIRQDSAAIAPTAAGGCPASAEPIGQN